VIFANAAYAKTFCGSESVAECYNINFMDSVHPDDQDIVEQCIVELIENEPHRVSAEYRIIDFQGNTRFFRWQACGILNEENKVIEIQAIGRDVAEIVSWRRLSNEQSNINS